MAEVRKRKVREGYTTDEMRVITDRMLKDSVEHLRVRLRAAWKKRDELERRLRHGTAV